MAMLTHGGLKPGGLSLTRSHQCDQTVTTGANGAVNAWRGGGAVPANTTRAEE